MGTKNAPGTFDCYANAAPDEPMFVLLARDKDAPAIVREWAALRAKAIVRGDKPMSDSAMVAEALACASAMEAFERKREAIVTRIDDDKRWQRGHVDGEEKLTPTSDSYAYVSGWIAGYCECEQCSGEEAEHAYLRIVQQEKK